MMTPRGAVFLIAILASLSAACASDVDKCVRAQMASWESEREPSDIARLGAEATFRLGCLRASGGTL